MVEQTRPLRLAIIGASGFTAYESIRLLLRHRHVTITHLAARPEDCGRIEQFFPALRNRIAMEVVPVDVDQIAESADAVFCCLPHRVSMSYVPRLLGAGLRVVDFSADYRIKDVQIYQRYYGHTHTDPANLAHAVYGLPELFADEIRTARLVANPGCFPTAAVLAVAPLLRENLIEPGSIVVHAVTGVSGGGRTPTPVFHFPHMNENLFAYGVGTHRHMPEIEQICSQIAGGPATVLFQPQVGPFDRGISSTLYAVPRGRVDSQRLLKLYEQAYRDAPFVRILGSPPAVKDVAYSNFCDIFPTLVKHRVMVFAAIDNLTKGAAGQAVQNLNLMYGFEQTEALL